MLTKLQQEFFDLLANDADIVAVLETEEEYQNWERAVVGEIRRMNAAELRQNIKAFRETQ